MEVLRIFKIGFRDSFICQCTSAKNSELERKDLFGFRVKMPPVTTSLSTYT